MHIYTHEYIRADKNLELKHKSTNTHTHMYVCITVHPMCTHTHVSNTLPLHERTNMLKCVEIPKNST